MHSLQQLRLRWAQRANNEALCCTEPSVAEPYIMEIHSLIPPLQMDGFHFCEALGGFKVYMRVCFGGAGLSSVATHLFLWFLCGRRKAMPGCIIQPLVRVCLCCKTPSSWPVALGWQSSVRSASCPFCSRDMDSRHPVPLQKRLIFQEAPGCQTVWEWLVVVGKQQYRKNGN